MRSQGEELGKQLPNTRDFDHQEFSRICCRGNNNLKPPLWEIAQEQDSPMANMQNSARTEQSQDFITSIDGFFNSQKHQKHGSKTKCCNEVSMFFGNIDETLMG